RLEPALVQGPGPGRAAVGVVPLGVGDSQPAQVLGQVAVALGPEDQVPVVGHQAVGQEAHGPEVGGLSEDGLEGGVVAILAEQGGGAEGGVEHVGDVAAGGAAGSAWHGGKSNPPGPTLSTEKTPDPFSSPNIPRTQKLVAGQ